MAATSGKFGSTLDLVATTDTLFGYTVATGILTSANVRLINRNSLSAKVRLAIGAGGSPALTDYRLFDYQIPGFGIDEETGLLLSAGEKIWVRSDSNNVSARMHGMEEAATGNSGKIGSLDVPNSTPTSPTYTQIGTYTPAALNFATAGVNLCNRTSSSISVRLAVGSTGAPPNPQDFILYDFLIAANGLQEETAIVMSPGEKLWVYANAAGISARAVCYEEGQ